MYRSELLTRVEGTQVALSQGRLADAEALSRALVQASTSWLEVERCAAMVNHAWVLLSAGRVAEAAQLVHEVVTLRDTPRNRRRHELQLLAAWHLQGQIALRDHNPAAAREPLRLAHEGYLHHRLAGEASTVLEQRLRAELWLGDHGVASELARERAEAYEAQGRTDLAAPMWTLSGIEAVESGQLELAEGALLRAAALHAAGRLVHDTIVCQAELAVVLHRMGQAEEAENAWITVLTSLSLQTDPGERARGAVVVGQAATRMGRYAEARTLLRPPEGGHLDAADDALRRRHLGEALAHTGQLQAARVELRAAYDGLVAAGQDEEAERARPLLILLGA